MDEEKRRAMETRRRIQEEKCRSKVAYESPQQAAYRAKEAGSLSGIPLRYYRCPVCRYWHLSKKDQFNLILSPQQKRDLAAFEENVRLAVKNRFMTKKEGYLAVCQFKKQLRKKKP